MRRLRFLLMLLVTVILAGTVAAILALTSDGEDDVAAGDDDGPVPELTVTAEIRRSFNRSGLVVIAVTNHGAVPVTVTSAELLSDSFEPTGPQPFDVTIPPGDTPRDLQVEYGLATCPDGIDSAAVESRVELRATAEGGGEHALVLDLPHPNGTLDRLLRTDCRDAALAEAVTLTMGPLTPRDDDTLTGVLTVTRVDGGAVPAVVTDTRGSVLFTITPQADPALPPGQLRIVADVLGCTGHAIGDAKRPYGFTAWIDLGDGEEIPTAIPVDDAHKAALTAMQPIRCAVQGDDR
ncbi:hypothetical protein [Jiangella anatolica]|uniref:Uncharacterized protein n=1 Tax=Jiangella anatolica TaxID=2670374 RepID=A0A2W2BGX5_9ACTN|nr:hypothetical protein [Jiangella anatolica]PZF86415.1 hypothetical protein C1I92_00965 [Jiangella anatolica]